MNAVGWALRALEMSLRLLAIFAVTEFLLSLTPGPAVLLVISHGVRGGLKSSLKGALGILAGNAVYFLLSALGLGALLNASATLFRAVRWIGAGYLIFLGLRMVLAKGQRQDATERPAKSQSGRLFSEGLVTQLSNPKAIIFFTALLPQFVTPGNNIAEQFVILGIVSIALEFPVLLAYGWAAERGGKLILTGKLSSLSERMAGGLLVGTGLSLAAIASYKRS